MHSYYVTKIMVTFGLLIINLGELTMMKYFWSTLILFGAFLPCSRSQYSSSGKYSSHSYSAHGSGRGTHSYSSGSHTGSTTGKHSGSSEHSSTAKAPSHAYAASGHSAYSSSTKGSNNLNGRTSYGYGHTSSGDKYGSHSSYSSEHKYGKETKTAAAKPAPPPPKPKSKPNPYLPAAPTFLPTTQ